MLPHSLAKSEYVSAGGGADSRIIRMRQSSQFQISDHMRSALSLSFSFMTFATYTSLHFHTTCLSFSLHHECTGQHQRRRIPDNSSRPSQGQQWKLDTAVVQCDARSHCHRPEHHRHFCSQPCHWKSFRRRRV